jgi:hypothetical protein
MKHTYGRFYLGYYPYPQRVDFFSMLMQLISQTCPGKPNIKVKEYAALVL